MAPRLWCGLPRVVSGRALRDAAARGWLGVPAWLLPVRLLDRDVVVTWLAAEWWRFLLVRIEGVAWRAAVALGVWEVKEMDYYRNGWLCARPWRNPASAWCLGWRRALWPWKG